MSYVTLAQMKSVLPADLFAQLLDDSGSGVADPTLWPEIVAAVTQEIDGKLGMRYPLPLTSVPPVIVHAALVLAAEAVYQRKNFYGDANPWAARANGIRGTLGQQGGQPGLLDRIASGETPLTPALKPQNKQAVAITSAAKTTPSTGAMLC